jgi:hypothetical protein
MDDTNKNKKEIFFHVGLAKTGTTFLQYRVFPKFEGVHYIQRTKYQRVIRLIRKSRHPRIFLSNEFDLQFETEMKKMGAAFPQIRPIVVFRRQDGYIASQYRRFLKNGFRGTFRDFFDLEEDRGFFKKRDLEFIRYIRILEENYKPRPIVLFYEDMRDDPERFILDLARRMDVRIDMSRVNLHRKHSSYSEKQLRAMMAVGRYINLKKKTSCKNTVIRFFCRLPQNVVRYPTLWIGGLLPATRYSNEPLIPQEELEKIREYYKEDWEACKRYAAAPGN